MAAELGQAQPQLAFIVESLRTIKIRMFVTKNYEYSNIFVYQYSTIFLFEYLLLGQNYSNIRIYSNIRSSLDWMLVFKLRQGASITPNVCRSVGLSKKNVTVNIVITL